MDQQTHFDPAEMLAEASAMTNGLTDFGDPSFRPALDALCQALETEAPLSEVGRGILRARIVGQLANRLWVEDWIGRHPEITDERIEAPLVIVGLPRTGSTKLQRLLSRDPRFWWMAAWESQFPVPMPGETLAEPVVRVREAHALVDMMTQAMPQLMAIHPMAAEEADEEVMLMEHSMLSAFDAYADIPGYVDWLDAQDQRPAYLYLRRSLQFLQWQKRQRGLTGERWLLKSPHHLLRMDLLLETFPGVQVIQTHRDPVESIPSIASFIHTLWAIHSDTPDPIAAGQRWSTRMRDGLDHTMSVRSQSQSQFLDVAFADTVNRPMDVVARIYDFTGWELTPEVASAMQQWLAVDAQEHDATGHTYSADAFGLSEEQLRRDFATYRAQQLGL